MIVIYLPMFVSQTRAFINSWACLNSHSIQMQIKFAKTHNFWFTTEK
jgi:hypothetical protein